MASKIRLICSRIGDPYHRGVSADTRIAQCALCSENVLVEQYSLDQVQGVDHEICCPECNVGSGLPIVGRFKKPADNKEAE